MLKHSGIRKKDLWVLLVIRPPFMALIIYILFGDRYFKHAGQFIPASMLGLFVMVISWRIHIYADHYLRARYKEVNSTGKRIIISGGCHFLIAILFISLLVLSCHWVGFLNYQFNWTDLLLAWLVGFCTNVAAIGFHEGVYIYEKWKKALVEAEQLKKLHLQSKLAGLRSQVNPHFLFNSINALSSLIENDAKQADQFLNEMCKVYRYLLNNNRDAFSLLKVELDFICSWTFIMQTRYKNAVQFKMDVSETQQQLLIPSLTILAFLENIIQTNVISSKHPVVISLAVDEEDYLLINHAVNKTKKTVNPYPDKSLEAVITRFRLMNLPGIETGNDGATMFTRIPLINQLNSAAS